MQLAANLNGSRSIKNMKNASSCSFVYDCKVFKSAAIEFDGESPEKVYRHLPM